MNINFTGHNIDLTDALREFTVNKFDKLDRHFDQISNVKVTFEVEKLRQIAEASVSIKGTELHASSEAESMYTAIDTLVDKLNRQVIKYKEKHAAGQHREKDQ